MSIAIGLISLAIFIVRQFRLENPLLDLRVYGHPIFALGNVVIVFLSVSMYAVTLLLPVYLQNVRGFTPMKSGLIMLPGALSMGLMSPIAGKLFDKLGARILAFAGITITGIATYFLSNLKADTSTTYIVLVYTLRYMGISMVLMPVMNNGLNQLPHRLYPHGSAINDTVQQVSGSLGAAIFVTIMTNQAKSKGTELAAAMKAKAIAVAKATSQKGAYPVSTHKLAQIKTQISHTAMLNGINFAFTVSIFVIAGALVLSMFLRRPRTTAQVSEEKGNNHEYIDSESALTEN